MFLKFMWFCSAFILSGIFLLTPRVYCDHHLDDVFEEMATRFSVSISGVILNDDGNVLNDVEIKIKKFFKAT